MSEEKLILLDNNFFENKNKILYHVSERRIQKDDFNINVYHSM